MAEQETGSPGSMDIERRGALREMIRIAAPTVVTMTSYTVMQFIDGLMVSQIGPDPVYVSAQGNGGMVVWVAMAVPLGLLTITSTFVSQNLGAGRPERGAAYGWNGLWLAALSALLILPLIPLAPRLFEAMGHSEELLALEVPYAQILAGGAFLTLASRALAHYFYGMHRPLVVMVAALVGNVVNVCANALLIFGPEGPPDFTPFAATFGAIAEFLGIPALGVPGAAIGTLIGTSIELIVPLFLFLGPRMNRLYATRSAWRPSARHVRDIARVGWPGGIMFGNELLCWAYLMTVLIPAAGAAAGDDPVVHNSAGWIALRYMHLSFMPAVGISIAVSAMVGKAMGMRRPDLAAQRAWLGLRLTLAYMGLCALVFVLFPRTLIGPFTPEHMGDVEKAALIAVGVRVMYAAAVFQLFDAMAITMSSALRGAGDTVWPGVVTVVLSWTCIVGVGHALIFIAPGIGSLGPWIGASLFIILLGIALVARFVGGRWRRIELVDRGKAPSQAPGEEAVAGTTPGSV